MFHKILIANDGSEGAARGLSAAIKLAKFHEADLHMISVEELPFVPASVDEIIEEKAEANHVYETAAKRAVAQAQAQGVKLTPHVLVGHPISTIADFVASEKIDLLIVGYMGHSVLYNRVIGSKTTRLAEYAPCAVLIIK